ncbi:MAG: hypothetical protein DMF63_17235 [Acidobacteria bacterium]|nr:MAG: hypothetical protein DMF63_17235 [Acidobacteriota bacterium]
MTKGTRNLLIIGGILISITIGLAGLGIYKVYSFFTTMGLNREVPAELKDARITTGAGFLTRTEFFKLDKPGLLKTIGESSKHADEKERQKVLSAQTARSIYNFSDLQLIGDSIIAVGEFGGFVFDLDGNLKSQILFDPSTEIVKVGPFEKATYQPSLDNLRIVRLDRDHFGFLSFGSTQGLRIFDDKGTEIWRVGKEILDVGELLNDSDKNYEKSRHVLEATVGDLDNDGISEYVVATKNEGIRAYDRSGKELWLQPDEFASHKLEVLDIDHDGKNELLEIGKAVRDGNGKIIRDSKIDGDAIVLADDGKESKIQFADIFDGKLTLSSEDGEKLFASDAPLSEIKKEPKRVDVPGTGVSYTDDADSVAYPKAALVQLHEGKPKYLAVIASFIGLPRANFYVYDADGVLVYHELLPEDAETIAVLPNSAGKDTILIGGKDTIWKYAAN